MDAVDQGDYRSQNFYTWNLTIYILSTSFCSKYVTNED